MVATKCGGIWFGFVIGDDRNRLEAVDCCSSFGQLDKGWENGRMLLLHCSDGRFFLAIFQWRWLPLLWISTWVVLAALRGVWWKCRPRLAIWRAQSWLLIAIFAATLLRQAAFWNFSEDIWHLWRCLSDEFCSGLWGELSGGCDVAGGCLG